MPVDCPAEGAAIAGLAWHQDRCLAKGLGSIAITARAQVGDALEIDAFGYHLGRLRGELATRDLRRPALVELAHVAAPSGGIGKHGARFFQALENPLGDPANGIIAQAEMVGVEVLGSHFERRVDFGLCRFAVQRQDFEMRLVEHGFVDGL